MLFTVIDRFGSIKDVMNFKFKRLKFFYDAVMELNNQDNRAVDRLGLK
jgi:hypothetical protein